MNKQNERICKFLKLQENFENEKLDLENMLDANIMQSIHAYRNAMKDCFGGRWFNYESFISYKIIGSDFKYFYVEFYYNDCDVDGWELKIPHNMRDLEDLMENYKAQMVQQHETRKKEYKEKSKEDRKKAFEKLKVEFEPDNS